MAPVVPVGGELEGVAGGVTLPATTVDEAAGVAETNGSAAGLGAEAAVVAVGIERAGK